MKNRILLVGLFFALTRLAAWAQNDCPDTRSFISTANDFNNVIHYYEASQTIEASNHVTGTSIITYDAGVYVKLKPQPSTPNSDGFKVQTSGFFKAIIDGCTGMPPASDTCAVPPSGMVAWWPMDEMEGDDNVADIIHFHEGDPKPNGYVGIPNGPGQVPGKVGGALYFLGPGNKHVEVSDTPDLNFGAGSFSIDAWINTPMGTQTEPIVDKLGPTNSGYSFSIQGISPYYVTLVIGKGNTVQVLQGPAIKPGDWNFVAVTVNPQKATFYVGNSTSGFTQSSVNIIGTNNASNTNRPLLIGNNPLNPHWNIMIDELEIFNRDLDSLELKAIWSADSLGKCKTIVSATNPARAINLRIFPNPNAGNFSVELPEATEPGMVFRILDLTGQMMREQQMQAGVTTQNVEANDLPVGLYFLQVVSEGKVLAVEKFVKL